METERMEECNVLNPRPMNDRYIHFFAVCWAGCHSAAYHAVGHNLLFLLQYPVSCYALLNDFVRTFQCSSSVRFVFVLVFKTCPNVMAYLKSYATILLGSLQVEHCLAQIFCISWHSCTFCDSYFKYVHFRKTCTKTVEPHSVCSRTVLCPGHL